MNHLIYFYSAPEPRMAMWKGTELADVELNGEFTADFSHECRCIGYQTENARHKCPHKRDFVKQCISCFYKDISKVYTRLDFAGFEHIKEEISKQNFSIYLALFGDSIVKCGVTRTERVEMRVMEQGADFWVELMRFDNADDAYGTEHELQHVFGFRNAVRMDAKMKIALAGKYNDANLAAAIGQVLANTEFSNQVHSRSINKLHYCTPRSFEMANDIHGRITGSKASLLFFKNNGNNFCINMRKKEGFEF